MPPVMPSSDLGLLSNCCLPGWFSAQNQEQKPKALEAAALADVTAAPLTILELSARLLLRLDTLKD